MDIGKILSALIAGFQSYQEAATDKTITVNEALKVAVTVIEKSGIGDLPLIKLKKEN